MEDDVVKSIKELKVVVELTQDCDQTDYRHWWN